MTYDTYYAKRGSRGPLVAATQRRLNEVMNASIAVDGIYGAVTQALMQQFQEQNGLATTTYLDPPTASALGIDVSAFSLNGQPALSTSKPLTATTTFIGMALLGLAAAFTLNRLK